MEYTYMENGMQRSRGVTRSARTRSGSKGDDSTLPRSREYIPAPPPGPGEALRLILKGSITQDALADAMGVSRFSVNQIINGRRAVTAEMALRLAHVTSTSAEFWLNLQVALDLYGAKLKLVDTLSELKVLRPPKSKHELFVVKEK